MIFHSAECTFEDPNLCGWTNTIGDDFDWIRANAGKSWLTGPKFDHTYGTAAGWFILIRPTNFLEALTLVFVV